MSNKPRWIDEVEVKRLVDDEMDQVEYEEAMEEFERIQELSELGYQPLPIHIDRDRVEREAIAKAREGDLSELAELVRVASWRARLPGEAWELICDFLRGYRFVEGKLLDPWPPRRTKGRPRMSEDEKRFTSSPVHQAAELVPAIEAILRRHYPDQETRQIRDRALTIAGQRAGMKTPDPAQTLQDYIQHGGIRRKRRRPKKSDPKAIVGSNKQFY
jgi:hypothetical protein